MTIGIYKSSAPTLRNGLGSPLLLDVNGNLKVSTVTIAAAAYGTRQTLTRCSDGNAYSIGDVIGIGTGGGTTTPGSGVWTFPIAPSGGGEVLITDTALEIDVTAVPSGMTTMTLHLYNVTPPSAYVDNVAWDLPAGDRTAYLGRISLGTPVDVGSTLWVEQHGINKQISALTGNVFGYLVTDTAWTPASATVQAIALHTIRL